MEEVELSKYIAWLRHRHTNYDKYLGIMYDELGNQTEVRKYVNHLLYLMMVDKVDGEKTLRQIKMIIKAASKKIPTVPKKKSPKNLKRKLYRHRKNMRDNDERWAKTLKKLNQSFEKEEKKIHRAYVQIMLGKIGLADVQLRKKLLPKE